MKKFIICLSLIIIFSSFLFAGVSNRYINTRSFSYTIKKDINDPFKVIFANNISTINNIQAIDSISIEPSETLSLAYYMVLAVKEYKEYDVKIRVSPFLSKKGNTLPARLLLLNDMAKESDSIDERISDSEIKIDISNTYGPNPYVGNHEFYFFGFYFAFPKEKGSYIKDTYYSTVTVEVSGA